MAVLLVILMFSVFIGLDYVVGRSRARRGIGAPAQAPAVGEPARTPAFVAEPVWVAGYQLPDDFHYHSGHTWARALSPSTALIGMDDFARKLIGDAKNVNTMAPGSRVRQGAKGFSVAVDGRAADFVSPLDGEVVEVNPELTKHPSLATDDPYGRGWVMKIRSHDLTRSLHNLLSGSLARRWMEDSRDRLELQLMALSGSVLQDGGEPVADFARQLDEEDWRRLVGEFLLT